MVKLRVGGSSSSALANLPPLFSGDSPTRIGLFGGEQWADSRSLPGVRPPWLFGDLRYGRDEKGDLFLILGATLVYSLCAWAGRLEHPLSFRSLGTLLGAGGLAAAGLRTATVPVAEWRRSVGTASAAALFPALVFGSLVVRRELLGRTGDTYDLFAFALDQRYGVQLSFVFGRLFATWPSVGSFFEETYHVLPLLLGLLYGLTRRDAGSGQAFRVALLLFVAGILGVAFYSMIPVCGPRFAFPDFPAEPALLYAGDLRLLALPTNIERNGVPSLHFAWALLVWWNLRRRSKAYHLFTGGFLAATVVATLGTGEHYWWILSSPCLLP